MAYLNEIIYPLPPLWNSSQIGRSRPAASRCFEPTGLVEEPIFESREVSVNHAFRSEADTQHSRGVIDEIELSRTSCRLG